MKNMDKRYRLSAWNWITTGLLALAAFSQGAVATETENTNFSILPAPGKVVVDGKFDDWDLSGSMFICSDVETYRDQFASWQSAMYDSENLYLLSRWIDTTPMNNPGLCGSDMGFAGDCLQARVIVNASGDADAKAEDKTMGQRTTHISAWSGRDGRHIIDLAYGKKFDEGGVKDALTEGAKQAFLAATDGKGYVQEIALPWKLLTRDGRAPKVGTTIIMTYEPNFGTVSKMRITTKDCFRAGVTPDRVFAFSAYDRWGEVKVNPSGKIDPFALRLADGRTFPVRMEKGIPVIDWSGLYKEEKMEGFAKINLTLPDDGVVSMVIRNSEGQVVRNLLNAQFLSQGKHEVVWDGLSTPSDRKPGDSLPAGQYSWEAIYHKGIGLSLVGWACNSGRAPFDSPGGNWGGDMGFPCSVDAGASGVILGWGASEAGKALVCVDLDGNVKWRHKRGGFGGAALVAVDSGIVFVYDQGQDNTLYRLDASKGEYANWKASGEATLEITKLLAPFKPSTATNTPALSGLAAQAGKIVLSYGALNAGWGKEQPSGDTLLVLDAVSGKLVNSVKVQNPGDLKTGADGRLYLVCGMSKIVTVDVGSGSLTKVIDGLKEARAVAADKDGNIYVSCDDGENQIKVFNPAGKLTRKIGKAGGRNLTGPWDKAGMRSVTGIKVDDHGKLWVMERDGEPRRISVWDAATGTFAKEFFGPTEYGAGGGAICPADPYTMIGQNCEWKLDKETGKAECVAVISCMPWGSARFGTGQNGGIYLAVGGGWHGMAPVHIFERVTPGNWKLRTKLSPMAKDPAKKEGELVKEGLAGVRVWADANGDEKEQPEECRDYPMELGSWIDGWYLCCNQALTFAGGAYRISVTGWTPCGAPVYDLTKAVKLPAPDDPEAYRRGGMGAQQNLISEDGNYVLYNGFYGTEHSDFPCFDIRTGKKVFSYPNNYVGVHGGHLAPPPKTGLIRAAYDIVGTVKAPAPLGNLFIIATDKGEWHILSSSGYYLSKLFEGDPFKIQWPEVAVPGVNMSMVPPGMGAEDFGGSVTMANDGTLYVQAGKTAFINFKVEGLNNVKRLDSGTLSLSSDDVVKAQGFKVKYLAATDNAKAANVKKQTVAFSGQPARDFGAVTMTYGVPGATLQSWLAHDATTLYAAWQVHDKTPWVNGATGSENLYACGDTVDLQLGADPSADKKRREAGTGDLRLSIGSLQGKAVAVLYRKVSADKAPKTFYSGTCKGGYTMELVRILDGVKIEVKPGRESYVVEAAIPLSALQVSLKPGLALQGDVGVTFSDAEGKDTNLRVYWSNQATGIVADEVEELKMQPSLWGEFSFE